MERLGSRVVVAARLIAGILAPGSGLGALAVAEGPGRSTTYAGRSHAAAALTLIVGLGLAATGLAMTWNRRTKPSGALALAAGVSWFAPVWVAWSDGPPLVRSLAMVVIGFTFPLVVQLVLFYPLRRAPTVPARALVGAAYLEAALAALVLALFRDPYFDPSCWANCTVNSFLIRSRPPLVHGVEIADRWFAVGAALTLIAICLARLAARQGPSRRRLIPVCVPAIAFAVSVVARAIALQSNTVEDPFNTTLFTIVVIQSTALILLAGGLLWLVGRDRAARAAVDRVVANLDDAPAPGTLQSALAHALHDPQLRISYYLSGPERYVDAGGHLVSTSTATRGRTVTRLTRKGRTIALIVHGGDGPSLESQLGPAVRLGLENERLRAQTLAQLEDLRASRTRIVETADQERRRLERDLHDGAQQHLLALSYEIRLAHTSAQANADRSTEITLAQGIEDTSAALDELRDLAHGIYPAVLTDAGLRPAVQTLADTAPVTVEVHAPPGRYPTPVETAAYFAIAEALDDAAQRRADHVAVTVAQRDGRLLVIVEDDGSDRRSSIVGLADRVGALRRHADHHADCLPAGDPVRVVVAEDVMLTREGIIRVLRDAGVDVVGEASDSESLLRAVRLTRPDAAIVDIRMPPTHTDEGLVAAQQIRAEHPDVGVLILSQYVEPHYAMQLLEEHPERVGYLLKDRVFDVAILIDALRRLADGETIIDPTIVSRLLGRRRRTDPLKDLTPREREVLALVAEGLSNSALAARLFVTERTVEAHVKQIFLKLALQADTDSHRRVLAVLAYVRNAT